MTSSSIPLFSANFMAIFFSSILEEYLFGRSPSMKLKMRLQLLCPMVDVYGLAEAGI
jgi:hypothetical protein